MIVQFIFDDDEPDVDPLDEWMTLTDARELAKQKITTSSTKTIPDEDDDGR